MSIIANIPVHLLFQVGTPMSYWIDIKITLTIFIILSLVVVGAEDRESVRITGVNAKSWDNLRSLPGYITWPKLHFKGRSTVNIIYAILTGR